MSRLYIQRKLFSGDEAFSEAEFLAKGRVLIVLAEPGAGKTTLLDSLAARLDTLRDRASIFRNRKAMNARHALVIDALDEVARIDKLATEEIIVKASELAEGTVIFASRSSEWEPALTAYVKECFSSEPVVVRLQPFDEAEQRALFTDWFPDESFDDFYRETQRFELIPLLGNPQFLQLFGEAFIAGGRRFTSKSKIFSDAVTGLAHEKSGAPWTGDRPAIADIEATAGQVFANLLLSGATGVSSTEQLDDRDFPFIKPLSVGAPASPNYLLDTRLFKPSTNANQHEPVHRLVAEYCAADYLSSRIHNAGDRLSLSRVFAVIAPNRVVRDELRGLLGWMAALGNPDIQKAAIGLDPYAVLANGDAARLTVLSKKLLLLKLEEAASKDPYFRRSDRWRRFNVGQFFDGAIIDELRPLLAPKSQTPELQQLLLELLIGSEAASSLQGEITSLLTSGDSDKNTRDLAFDVLETLPSFDGKSEFASLLQETTSVSMRLASGILRLKGIGEVGFQNAVALLRQLATLYPQENNRLEREFGSRYYFNGLIGSFSLAETCELLDALTDGLVCTCGADSSFRCRCRTGISKIVGKLLDHYFELHKEPHSPDRIWHWVKGLHFPASNRPHSDCPSVKALAENSELRQAIQILAFEGVSDTAKLHEIMMAHFGLGVHAGIRFQQEDLSALARYAFEYGNSALWSAVWTGHNRHTGQKESYPLRALMRSQARSDPNFMRIWAERDRNHKRVMREHERRWPSRNRRYELREERIREANLASLRDNRKAIEAGKHWGWLDQFSHYYLVEPDKLPEIVDDIETAYSALRNCFPFLSEHIPTLEELGEGSGWAIVRALHAACLLHFRENCDLGSIDERALRAVRTDLDGYPAYVEGEKDAFRAEIDRLIFVDKGSDEAFIRTFIEPQIAPLEDRHTNASLLDNDVRFHHLRKSLPLEWLKRFPHMPYRSMVTFFEMAVQHGDRRELIDLIHQRAKEDRPEVIEEPSNGENAELKRHEHWLMASFFFEDDPEIAWSILRQRPENIFLFSSRIDRFGVGSENIWPQLGADKIYLIYDAFSGAWPKVPLPSSYGTGDPPGETAYRFLADLIWQISRDRPQRALPVLGRMVDDPHFVDFEKAIKTLRVEMERKSALQDFRAPAPAEIASLLNDGGIASVEDLRALLLEELEAFQIWVHGDETTPIVQFYPGGKRLDENTSRDRIVDRLKVRMTALNLSVVIEHQMADEKRCDFTAAATISGKRSLLVVEVKGQWHKALYTAASEQLDVRYAIHPEATRQGVYLVLWFGAEERVAGLKNPGIATPLELRQLILEQMPSELKGLIDVFVLDLSK